MSRGRQKICRQLNKFYALHGLPGPSTCLDNNTFHMMEWTRGAGSFKNESAGRCALRSPSRRVKEKADVGERARDRSPTDPKHAPSSVERERRERVNECVSLPGAKLPSEALVWCASAQAPQNNSKRRCSFLVSFAKTKSGQRNCKQRCEEKNGANECEQRALIGLRGVFGASRAK